MVQKILRALRPPGDNFRRAFRPPHHFAGAPSSRARCWRVRVGVLTLSLSRFVILSEAKDLLFCARPTRTYNVGSSNQRGQAVAMEPINLETWERRDHFLCYLGTDFPYIFVTADVDVTRLHAFTRRHGISFYLAMVYAATAVANGIENFRYRIADGKPCLLDCIHPGFTHLRSGSELFVIVEPEAAAPDESMVEFCRRARTQADRPVANHGMGALKGRLDVIIYSSMPWVRYTQFIRPVAKIGQDSTPKISWGRFERQGERLVMPFSLQVHHGLMDGYHLGLYFQRLQEFLDAVDQT